MNYGIEFEFFVEKDGIIVPAYQATSNLDGNPVVGELKTGVHTNIIDCIFELKKFIFNEITALNNKGYNMRICPLIKVDDSFLVNLRKDKSYINRKQLDVLEEYSIYPGGLIGKMLPRKEFKASLQINVSKNNTFEYVKYKKITVEDKYKYKSVTQKKQYSSVFNYLDLLYKLDVAFAQEIKNTNRVKGVYAIKDGILGTRIEYRSLPNTVDLEKIIKTLV